MTTTLIRYFGREAQSVKEIESLARLLARGASLGWRTHLVFAKPPEDEMWLRPLNDIGVQIEYIPRTRQNFNWQTIQRAYQLCRGSRASIFHVDNIHTSPLIGAALARVPIRVWSKRSMEPAFEKVQVPTWRERWAPSLHLSCHLATRTIAVSAAVKHELIELGIPRHKISVLHNSVDRKTIRLGDRPRSREALGYHDSHVVITTVGRAAPVKGWDTLLAAFAEVSKTLPQARLLFIGGTDRADECAGAAAMQRFIEAHQLHDYVRFVGHQEYIGETLSATDIFVSPSRSEGYGVALQEAFTAGYPCVATNVGIAPTMILHEENGLIVERDNPRALAQALMRLAADGDLRLRFATAARRSNFGLSTEEYIERLYGFYQCLLKGKDTALYETREMRGELAL